MRDRVSKARGRLPDDAEDGAVGALAPAQQQPGGAVVADSKPDDEYTETLDKARAIAASLSFEI